MAQQTITALFDDYEAAGTAVARLEATGIPHDDISVVGNNENDRHADRVGTGAGERAETADKAEKGAGTGASLGTVLGGGAGLLAGLGLLAIPGVGPVVAAGWLVATITGAGIGAAAGGLVGGLTGAGLNEADAHTYSEGVRRGGSLVTVRADDAQAATIMNILEEHGSVDVGERAKGWQAEGWAPPKITSHADAPGTGAADGRTRVRAYPTTSV